MKYLNTKYQLFKENLEGQGVHKYEIVEFTQEFLIENIFGGDENVNVRVKKGEKAKLYFDITQTDESKYVIIGFRPIEAAHTESNEEELKEKEEVNLSELWEANFILDNPLTINKADSPFKVEDYI